MAKLSESTKKQLRAITKKQAEKIAKEFEEKMCKKYESLIDWYYSEPYKTNRPHYERTGNLRRSYIPYLNATASAIITGIEITGENMSEYGKRQKISGEDYLNKFFYNPSGTWHGGDWHGGYGVLANFNVRNEMTKFYLDTVKDFRKKYGI